MTLLRQPLVGALTIILTLTWVLFLGFIIGRASPLCQTAYTASNAQAAVPPTVYILTIGDITALHSWGPFSSWELAYARLHELHTLQRIDMWVTAWEIAPRQVDGPLSTIQAQR